MLDHIPTKGATLAARTTGSGPQIALLHALGQDHTIWDALSAYLPNHQLIAIDLRGHGASSVPDGPYTMGGLITDVEMVLDHYGARNAVVIGLSVGGMIAQGLAVKRLDLVRAMVLCCTSAKFGQPEPWHDRAATARASGLETLIPATLDRWGRGDTARAEQRLRATSPEGYAATCEAIAGTDFYTPTSGLRLPTLGIAGDRDKSTPPDLVRETTALIPGSEFHIIRGAGHIAPETHPAEVARLVTAFLDAIGHN